MSHHNNLTLSLCVVCTEDAPRNLAENLPCVNDHATPRGPRVAYDAAAEPLPDAVLLIRAIQLQRESRLSCHNMSYPIKVLK
jgi:hypothetical protein